MKTVTRRKLCQNLSLMTLVPALGQSAAAMQTPKDCVEPELNQCAAYPWEALPVRTSSEGAATRQFFEGRIPGGEIVELHETTIKPGKMPHPPHRHPHAEMLLLRQGTIEFITDNAPVRVTAGGAAYCAPNQLHGFKNVGDGDATYFVLKIGSQPVCQR